jgi:ABC-2 type transport system ATP-binding protein
MTHLAIDITNLHKTYGAKGNRGSKLALDGVSLQVKKGAFFGLLGPNGAGKSTLINIMAGLVIKSAGTVKIAGYDIDTHERQAKHAIGVVPQELVLDTFFTVRQALDIHAGYYGVPKAKRRTQEIIDAMGLTDKADAKPRALSGGMRRRLLIGKALVHTPEVLILDEPTAGVDIELRKQLWDYVRELNANGTTILLTTHYLEEAEQLCDDIAIINRGKVVACDTKQRLMAGFENKRLLIRVSNPPAFLPEALSAQGFESMQDGRLSIRYKPDESDMESILASLRDQNLHIADLTTTDTDLEDIFRHLTSESGAGTVAP